MSESQGEELSALFAPNATKQLDPDVLAELESTMRLHSISPQELFYKWESYSMKIGNDMKLNIDTARALKKEVQESFEREVRNKTHVKGPDRRVGATPKQTMHSGDIFGMLDGMAPSTPRPGSMNKQGGSKRRVGNYETPSISRLKLEPNSSPPEFKKSRTAATPQAAVAFNDRTNAGQTIEVLNDQLEQAECPIAPYGAPRIKLVANTDLKKFAYKPMGMKQSEASEILDDRIDEFMLLVQAHHNLDDSAFGSAASKNTNEVIAVGRIASDSADGKLNTSALVLEMSRRIGAGLRVHLKVDKLPSYQFFPGQIVAVKGINVSGGEFTVSAILDIPLLPVAASTPSQLEVHSQRLQGGPDAMESDSIPAPLNIMIASGPYTADDNLDFEPLHTLISEAADTYADALVLAGPFLDIDHPLIATGDFDLPEEAVSEPDTATMTTVFRYLIAPILQRLHSSNPSITVLLIPSVRDAISTHVSWPQEPFPRPGLGLPKSCKIVGNPMTLSLNEIVMGVSSQDILYGLRDQEVVGENKSKDGGLLSRLPRYLIEQRHFFPLFPPIDRSNLPKTGTVEGIAAGSSLDLSYMKLGEILNVRPDLLITPSALPPFAKVVESTLVINPGFLSKRKAAGTYAKLTVHPQIVAEEDTNSFVAHELYDRARVDIIRI